MRHTALEQFADLVLRNSLIKLDIKSSMEFENLLNQSKFLEKEQIKDAFINGANIDSDTYGVDAEQYYSETFKSE
jgi:hypothetical protein